MDNSPLHTSLAPTAQRRAQPTHACLHRQCPAFHVKRRKQVLRMGAMAPTNSYTMWITSGLRKKKKNLEQSLRTIITVRHKLQNNMVDNVYQKDLKTRVCRLTQSIRKPLQRKWFMFILLHFAWQKVSRACQEPSRQSRGGYQSRKTCIIVL